MYDLLIKDSLVVDSFQEYMRKRMLQYQVILIETAELSIMSTNARRFFDAKDMVVVPWNNRPSYTCKL